MDLFTPDLFSKTTPEFISVSELDFNDIRSVLQSYYPHEIGIVQEVQQLKGNEINSINFKIKTTERFYLIKKISSRSNIAELSRLFNLNNILHDNDVPFPRVIPCIDGSLVVKDSNAQWCVLEFLQGSYFSGESMEELESAGYMIGKLHKTLQNISGKLWPKEKISYFREDDDKIISEFNNKQNEWPDIVGEETALILQENKDLIRSTFELINSKKEIILKSRTQVSHIDLHPHNILVQNNRLSAFLDIDSMKIANVRISIAFSIYKLMKQHSVKLRLSDHPSEISNNARRLFAAMNKLFPFTDQEIYNLSVFAVVEILRRILIILRLNIYNQNGNWNHVLPVHLAGIKETGTIFNSISG